MVNQKVKRRGWSGRTLVRYILLQIPALAALIIGLILVQHWVTISVPVSIGILAFWILKEIILFPFVWRAYDTNPSNDSFSMIGLQGTAEEDLNPLGYVRVKGELWRAKSDTEGMRMQRGETIEVKEVRGLTLIVKPTSSRQE